MGISALQWLRDHADVVSVSDIRVPPEYACDECPAGVYRSTMRAFRGRIPMRMVYQLRRESPIRTDSVSESLTIISGDCCEFIRIEYQRIED